MIRPGPVAVGVLLAATLGSAIWVVKARHQSRVLFAELSRLQHQRDALRIDFGRLEIEQATWAEPSRVERVARQKLGMMDAPKEDVQVLRR